MYEYFSVLLYGTNRDNSSKFFSHCHSIRLHPYFFSGVRYFVFLPSHILFVCHWNFWFHMSDFYWSRALIWNFYNLLFVFSDFNLRLSLETHLNFSTVYWVSHVVNCHDASEAVPLGSHTFCIELITLISTNAWVYAYITHYRRNASNESESHF